MKTESLLKLQTALGVMMVAGSLVFLLVMLAVAPSLWWLPAAQLVLVSTVFALGERSKSELLRYVRGGRF